MPHTLRSVRHLLAITVATPAAASNWQYQILPAQEGAVHTSAYCLSPHQAGGYSNLGNFIGHAIIWNLPDDSITDIHPAGATDSRVYSTDGIHQVGQATFPGGIGKASVWSGTADSWVDLHPKGYSDSDANSISGMQVVGNGYYPGGNGYAHAIIWPDSTKENFIDVNPANAYDSRIYITDGTTQYGYATVAGTTQAARWQGTKQSFTSLNPVGYDAAAIYGGTAAEQVGQSLLNDVRGACLWHSTKQSFVDLNPPGCPWSSAGDSDGVHQVGYAEVDNIWSAAFWAGSIDSYVNLEDLLPADYASSEAAGIVTLPDGIWIAGHAYNQTLGREDAILWHLPACPADCDGNGLLDVFDFLCFQNTFNAGDPSADCDQNGSLNIFDYFCFINVFNAGCP